MKVIIDTNIVFSAVLNTNGKIGDLLLNSGTIFSFYSCHYLHDELANHKPKLLKAAKNLTIAQIDTAIERVLSPVTFINGGLLSPSTWLVAEGLTRDIDEDDTEFVALTEELAAILWSGDKVLYNGLRAKGYSHILNTDDLWNLRLELTKS